jgi:putative membrane peptidase
VEKKRKRLGETLHSKYRLVLSAADTYQEVWGMRLSKLNFLVILGAFFLVVIALSFLLIFFTPIREFIPGYTSTRIAQQVVSNALKADSLSREIDLWDSYLSNLRTILAGGGPSSYTDGFDSTSSPQALDFTKSYEDSLFRMHVEKDLQENGYFGKQEQLGRLRSSSLRAPLRGEVTGHFDAAKGHYAVDVVAAPRAPIVAVNDGVVVLVTWDADSGNTLVLQHADGLLSVYKHTSSVLKLVGDLVRGGEVVAIVGDTGMLTTGPHLHFEIWANGRPLNPESYISF